LLALYGVALLFPAAMSVIEPTWLDSTAGDTVPWEGRVHGAALFLFAGLLIAPPRLLVEGRAFTATLGLFAVLLSYWSFAGVRLAGTAHNIVGSILAFLLVGALYLLPSLLGLSLWLHERRRLTRH
jgi:hypothetical protein